MNKKIIIIAILAGFLLGTLSTLAIGVSAATPVTLNKVFKKVKQIRNTQAVSIQYVMTYLDLIAENRYTDSLNIYRICQNQEGVTSPYCRQPESPKSWTERFNENKVFVNP